MKIVSWNVNGVRAQIKKNFVNEVRDSQADIYCIQETKAQDDQVAEALKDLDDYYMYSHSAVKKGYSGVAIISKEEPIKVTRNIGIEEHDQEGRVISAEYKDFILVNVYVPNSGSGLKRLDYRATWDMAFAEYLTKLHKKKKIIVTGDFNVAHTEIDLARPKSNYNKTSGFTQTEIDGLEGIHGIGLIDSYRALHPDKIQYSFWSARQRARLTNVGWRIDYFLVDKRLKKQIKTATIDDQIMGSDHCPISVSLDF